MSRPTLAAVLAVAVAAATVQAWPEADGGPRFLFERPLIRLPRARLAASLPPGCSSLAGPACLYGRSGDDDDAEEDDGDGVVAPSAAVDPNGGFQVLVLPPNDAAVAAIMRGDAEGCVCVCVWCWSVGRRRACTFSNATFPHSAAAALDLASARVVYQGNAGDGDAESVAAAVAGAVAAGGEGVPAAGAALRHHLASVLGAAQQAAAAAAAPRIDAPPAPRAALDVVEGRLGDAAAPAARAVAPRAAAASTTDPPPPEPGLAALDDADPAAPPPEGAPLAGWPPGGVAAPPDDTPFPPHNATTVGDWDAGDVNDDDAYYDDDYYDDYEEDPLDEIDPLRGMR